MSSSGYGAIGQSKNNKDKQDSKGGPSASSLDDSRSPSQVTGASTAVASPQDYFQTGLGSTGVATISPSVSDEKKGLIAGATAGSGHNQSLSGDMKAEHDHDHNHQHAPGENCCLPHMIQPMISQTSHDMVENVVIKVRDSADVTQKTIFYFWDEWKLFVNRGNVIDLGIGVVIGGAFSDIIDSFVSDILTPPLSLWAYGTNLENSFFVLRHGRTPRKVYATYLEAQADGAVTENTGQFFKACLNFLFIAFFLFWIVKAVHNIRKEKIKPPPKEKTCNWCKEQIALDAFRCKFCQSFVKDIPGLEDAGVGMFVTVKKPRHTPSPSTVTTPAVIDGKSVPPMATNSTMGPADGKKIAAALAQMESVK